MNITYQFHFLHHYQHNVYICHDTLLRPPHLQGPLRHHNGEYDHFDEQFGDQHDDDKQCDEQRGHYDYKGRVIMVLKSPKFTARGRVQHQKIQNWNFEFFCKKSRQIVKSFALHTVRNTNNYLFYVQIAI